MWDALSSLSLLRRGVKLGWRARCGLASVHCLPRPTAPALPFGYSSKGDELAAPGSKLAGVEWDDGVAGSSSVWTSTECVRPSEAPPPSAHVAAATLEMHEAAISSNPVTCVNPASRKGVSGMECLSVGAAGRWSYGNERCVGDLATVLLHSCVKPAASPFAGFVEASAATGRSCCDSGCC
jgi:hypothetical protein